MAQRILLGVGGTLAGSVAGIVAFIIGAIVEDTVTDYQGPLSSRVGDASGVTLILNVLWLAGVPALAAATIAAVIGGAGGGWQISRRLVAIGVGTLVGILVSPLIWTLLRGAQGPNPVLFAGFGCAALSAAVFMLRSPVQFNRPMAQIGAEPVAQADGGGDPGSS